MKPYTFNPAPFIANKKAVQQGYVTSEPLAVEKEGGFKPNDLPPRRQWLRHLRDDHRDPPRDSWRRSPDVVQRFVDASTIGWYNYLYGDNKAANALIKKDNPEMTRRADRLLDRQDEGIRHRRFGRRDEARHRRHDGRAA